MPWSSEFYVKHGHILPPDGWDILAKHDAILFGAIGSPQVPEVVTVHGLLLPMRRKFDQYVNLRPAYLFDGVESPLRDKAPGSIDMFVYRENTEGEYSPIGGRLYPGTPHEIATATAVFTRRGCERILRAARSESARKRKKRLVSISKANGSDAHARSVGRHLQRCPQGLSRTSNRGCCWSTPRRWTLSASRRRSTSSWPATNLFGDILTDLSSLR